MAYLLSISYKHWYTEQRRYGTCGDIALEIEFVFSSQTKEAAMTDLVTVSPS